MSQAKQNGLNLLAGCSVIEIGHSVAAPFATQVLADLGATVIKVENPDGGDDARHWGPPFIGDCSATFQAVNRNKRSVAINLKEAAGVISLKQLIAGADIVVQNMRPGLVERYGIDGETLRKENPRLIYCNIGAFGKAGPLRDFPGYDPLIQAFSGIMDVTGEPGRPPVRVGPSLVDMGAALWSVIGVLSALIRRRQTGEGMVVDTSLFETGLSWMNIAIANTVAAGADVGKSGSETPMVVPYRAFRANDRYIVIAAGNDNLFRRLCTTLEKPEWVDDPRFITNTVRIQHRDALNRMIEELIATRSSQEWSDRLNKVGVPCALVQSPSEVIAHAQTQALEILLPASNGQLGLVGLPLSFNGERSGVQCHAPTLGADTDKILQEPSEHG